MLLKPAIINLLGIEDYSGIIELSKKNRSALRTLISLTNEETDISRKAIEAIGKITSTMFPDEARKVIQRILWMMRAESGSSLRSGPEIIGEIVRANPEPFADIVPIIASFHGEEFFIVGVLRAMGRLAEVMPEMITPFKGIILGYAEDPDPEVRENALYALRLLKTVKPSPPTSC